MKAIVLLSGGLDSAVAAAVAKHNYDVCLSLSFGYGQRHFAKEVSCAYHLSRHFDWPHKVLELPPLGKSALTTPGEPLEERPGALPTTFVPARNLIFISFAASYAYQYGAQFIIGGWNVIDYSGYPDCRPEFLATAERACQLALDMNQLRVVAPLVGMTKAGIIRLGHILNVPFEHTWSCYAGGDKPCGQCPSCQYRAKGFEEAGIPDPLLR